MHLAVYTSYLKVYVIFKCLFLFFLLSVFVPFFQHTCCFGPFFYFYLFIYLFFRGGGGGGGGGGVERGRWWNVSKSKNHKFWLVKIFVKTLSGFLLFNSNFFMKMMNFCRAQGIIKKVFQPSLMLPCTVMLFMSWALDNLWCFH